MGNYDLTKLVSSIASRKCVLFAGAGLTAGTGGINWDGLILHLKDKFGYSSPLDDNFLIMGDMCKKYNPNKIYDVVCEKLKNAQISEQISKLTALPWFTTFTTNYDLALEKSLIKNQSKLSVRVILTGDEFALTGLPSEMLCVKLMGSLDRSYRQPGSMVLTPGELIVARDQRSRIFDLLASHAANCSFLFIGYSFRDKLFLEILDKLWNTIGTPKNTYYALFKDAPDESTAYLLQEYGVEIIIDDLNNFSKNLCEQISIYDPGDFSLTRIPIGNDAVPIDPNKVTSFLSLHNPILFEDLEKHLTPDEFFKGNTASFNPFSLGWHFQRAEINKLVELIVESRKDNDASGIVAVRGSPGSGKSFTILASIFHLIKNHRSIVVKIPFSAFNPIPSKSSMSDFLIEVEKSTKERNIELFQRIVFWADFTPDPTVIAEFKKLSKSFDRYPMNFIFETSQGDGNIEEYEESDISSISVDCDLSGEQKEELSVYLSKIIREHKFAEKSDDELKEIINDEQKFLPIMYRALDPAKRSINRIIQEEFSKVNDNNVRNCIAYCALSTSMESLEMPISILRNVLGQEIGELVSYPEVFDIAKKGNDMGFVKESSDPRTNIFFSIYHPLVAKQLVRILGKTIMDKCLVNIAKVVDVRSPVEAEFVRGILIDKGVRNKGDFKPFTDEGLEEALVELKKRQPSRPIIHHLARFYSNKNVYDSRIIPLLNEALVEPRELYALEERKENVLTTLAKTKWDQNKVVLTYESRYHPDIQEIIDLLIQARRNVKFNAHPFFVHARILKELALLKNDDLKMALINEALEVISEGLDLCYANYGECEQLKSLQVELLSEIDVQKAEIVAKELLENQRNGTGYYTLARIEYDKNSNPYKASSFLDKAMKAEICPPGAIELKCEIIIQSNYPDYNYLLGLIDKLYSDFEYQSNWKSLYYKAVIYTLNGKYKEVVNCFKDSYRLAPRSLQRFVQLFSLDTDPQSSRMGHRKIYNGIIHHKYFTESTGSIYSHSVEGLKEDIFFKPQDQKYKSQLRRGLPVYFELGFSPRGPIAFEVRPTYVDFNDIREN